MTPFFIDIGLNQEQIALSQMIFTVVLMVLDIPLGWVADRFSRKWANVIGVAADIRTEYSMLATLIIFVPISIPIVFKLKKER